MRIEGRDWKWTSGQGASVKIGVVNKQWRRCCGHRGAEGTDHGQFAYKVECMVCGYVYGANGSDMHERRCPMHDRGKPGIAFWIVEPRKSSGRGTGRAPSGVAGSAARRSGRSSPGGVRR